jgi:putative transposase
LVALLAPLALVVTARVSRLRPAPVLVIAVVFVIGFAGAAVSRVGFAWVLSFAKILAGGQRLIRRWSRDNLSSMIALLLHLLRLFPFLCGGHRQLALENLALRHQVAVYKWAVGRPRLRTADRLFWVGLTRVWAGWKQSLVFVTPDTVVRWQRRRFRKHWARLSGRRPVGRPSVNAEIIALVRRMASANPLWGAPRIHGELFKLGIDVAERTVSRLISKPRLPPSQTWRTFLTNHVSDLVSIDFFTVPTARLRVLFVLVVLAHHRRRVLHFNVTEHPTAAWTAQQIVDTFPDDTAPAYLLRDRDATYGDVFRQRVKGMQIEEILTAPRSPWQNPFAERLIGSIRRDCLDHVIVLSERHLRNILTAYFAYYHHTRTHLALTKDAPDGRPVEPPEMGKVMPIREVGGLHHRYVRRAA